MTRRLPIALGLALATAALYAQTARFDFVALDDDIYVYENPDLDGPLGWEGLAWAFAPEIRVSNWHPVTMWTLRLDAAAVGRADARRYHVVNALLHGAATLLAFWALVALTGRDVESGLVALVFAVHPLHVESVAWVASRKDVLAGCGWWASIGCYAVHAHRSARGERGRAALAYAGCLAGAAFALLSKPSAVTLPFVLALFDVWPLARARRVRAARLVAEKLPVLALAIAVSAATLWAQSGSGAMEDGAQIALVDRLANALVAYARYVVGTLWPTDLSLFYPYPGTVAAPPLAAWQISGAAALLAALSGIAALAGRRGHASVPVGWLYFLGTLVPMIGVVQVGLASHADRYTYLSQSGLVVAAVFGASEWLRARRPAWRAPALGAALAATVALGVAGHRQVALWRDTPTLFEHVLAASPRNALAHYNYANWLQQYGAHVPDAGARAERHYRAALAVDPKGTSAAVNLGLLLVLRGDRSEGMALLEEAAARAPLHAGANLDLGLALAQTAAEQGGPPALWARARRHLERSLDGEPPPRPIERQRAHRALAGIAQLEGDLARARAHWERAVELDPRDPVSLLELARVLALEAARSSGPSGAAPDPDGLDRARALAARAEAAARRSGDAPSAERAAALGRALLSREPMEPPQGGRGR